MPLQSVELLLDPEADETVRVLWKALSDNGIPSQADHHGPTNAPHVTLAAVPVVTDAAEEALIPLAARLPLRLDLTRPVLLGEHRPALVLAIRHDDALDALHEQVRAVLGNPGSADDLPWVPHVTLARRLPDDLAPRALALAGSLDVPASVAATALRRWDPERREAWLAG